MKNVCPVADVILSAELAAVLIQWMSFIRKEAEAENAAESGLPAMLETFTQTAGGGRARKTPGANMRFKVLHKFYDFADRFAKDGSHGIAAMRRCVSDAGAVI